MNKSWQSPSEITITATWRQHRSIKLKLEEWGQLCMSRRSRLSSVIKWTKPYHPCENTLSSNPATVFLYLHICVCTRQPVGWTVLFLISTRLWAGIIWLAHKPSIPSPPLLLPCFASPVSWTKSKKFSRSGGWGGKGMGRGEHVGLITWLIRICSFFTF